MNNIKIDSTASTSNVQDTPLLNGTIVLPPEDPFQHSTLLANPFIYNYTLVNCRIILFKIAKFNTIKMHRIQYP